MELDAGKETTKETTKKGNGCSITVAVAAAIAAIVVVRARAENTHTHFHDSNSAYHRASLADRDRLGGGLRLGPEGRVLVAGPCRHRPSEFHGSR